MKAYKGELNSGIKTIIIKFLKEDSDFLRSQLSKKTLKEFQGILKDIEKRVPKENIQKLSSLKEKNQDPRLLIETIFESNEDRYKELLISNFENNLMSSSRASDKLIIFYKISKKKFVIIHSKLKKALYSQKRGEIDYIRIEESLLDQKDFLRIIFFEKDKSIVYVKIKEISQSTFFDRWINFKKLRKSYNKELVIEIKLGNEIFLYPPDISSFYTKLLNNEIKIKNDQLIFYTNGDINQQFKISSIEFEDNVYSSKKDFVSFLNHFYVTQRYPELIKLTENFHFFISKLRETLVGWFSSTPSNIIELFENQNKVYFPDNENLIFNKLKLEDIDYLICSGEYPNCSIKPDKDFLNLIASEITKNIPFTRILHLHEIASISNPIKINSILIMNEVEMSNSYELLETKISRLLESRRDSKLFNIIRILKYYLFMKSIKNKYIKFFLKNVLDNFCMKIDSDIYLDKEVKILEFKSKRAIEKKGSNDIKNYFMEIAEKYCHFQFKFIIVGMEDIDKIDGIDEKYFSSDLIGNIQEELEIFLKKYNKAPFLQHIRIKENQFLIVFMIY